MADWFPYVQIPPHLQENIGKPDTKTRIYRRYGKQEEVRDWFDAVSEVCGDEGSISPGGVAGYVRVSRAAVHKRLKTGRLTAFLFHLVADSDFSKSRKTLGEGGTPYTMIPVSEAKAWVQELSEMKRFDPELAEVLASGDGDTEGKILQPPKEWRKKMKGGD